MHAETRRDYLSEMQEISRVSPPGGGTKRRIRADEEIKKANRGDRLTIEKKKSFFYNLLLLLCS
jgi:hypothetical protein